jgi:ceramide glucosyltransferase
MRWEAVAVNVDFWSQVLQSQSLKPMDFALGAVMLTRRQSLEQVGGFRTLVDVLADDYQLGNRIASAGQRVVLSPVVVECWSDPMNWSAVWHHQLRWARTIRVCAPMPYFLSILSNPTLWPLIWAIVNPGPISATFLGACLLARVILAWDLERRLAGPRSNAGVNRRSAAPMAPIKDMLQCALWFCAFAGNRVEWQGQTLRLKPDGTVTKVEP